MTLDQFRHILRRRMRTVVLFVLLGLVAGAIWAVLTPPRYTASVQVLVNVRAPETVGQPTSVADQLAPDYLSTQSDIIRSDRILGAAVEKLGLSRDTPRARELGWKPAFGAPAAFFMGQLRSQVALSLTATSRVLRVSITSADPVFSARAADAVAQSYRDGSVSIQAEPARLAVQGYDEQARDLTRRWAAEQRRLAERQRALGVTVASEGDGGDAESTRLASLSGQLANAEATRASASARSDREALPDSVANPVVQRIQQDLATAEARRAQLATTAGPNNVDLMEVTGQIAALRAQLRKQRQEIQQSASSAARQSAVSVSMLNAAVAAQKRRAIDEQVHRGEIALIEQSLENIRQTYNQVMQRRSQLNVMDTVGQANVTLLSRADVPSSPRWPRPFLMIGFGAVGGLIAGLLAAIALNAFGRRLAEPDDIEAWSGLPFLGGVGLVAAPSSTLALPFFPRDE